jgi:hypothetical protein
MVERRFVRKTQVKQVQMWNEKKPEIAPNGSS